MRRKEIIALLSSVALLLCLPFSLTETAFASGNNQLNNEMRLGVVKKNLATNTVQQENVVFKSDGSISYEIVDTWDDTLTVARKKDNTGIIDLSGIQLRTIIGDDGRTVVSNTTQFPYSAIVYLDVRFGNKTYRGTGFLIADDIVVTAGHCLYNAQHGWASSVTVIPGRNGLLSMPFGLAVMEEAVVSAEWYVEGLTDYDWGILHISNSLLGNYGVLSFSTVGDTFEAIPAKISGYPSRVGANQLTFKQYEMDGVVYEWGNLLFHFIIDVSKGQSGSPILDENNTVIGICTGEESS